MTREWCDKCGGPVTEWNKKYHEKDICMTNKMYWEYYDFISAEKLL